MNKLFKKFDDLKVLNRIPVNQSPLIPRSSSITLSFLVWGLRSKIDQILIKRIMRKKNPSLRYRLFKSLNWIKVYQKQNLEERISSYFDVNMLSENMKVKLTQVAINRKSLDSWPLANTDIINAIALNIEMKLLEESNKNENLNV